MPIGYLL